MNSDSLIQEKSKKTKSPILPKHTFFLIVKTLHKIAHASIYQIGRAMIAKAKLNKENECFDTPATNALTGEAGNAIGRYVD